MDDISWYIHGLTITTVQSLYSHCTDSVLVLKSAVDQKHLNCINT